MKFVEVREFKPDRAREKMGDQNDLPLKLCPPLPCGKKGLRKSSLNDSF